MSPRFFNEKTKSAKIWKELPNQNEMIITSNGRPIAILSSDSALTEQRLNQRTLMIDLEDEEFTNPRGLLISDFLLANAPAGLSIQSVNGSKTQVELAQCD